MSNLRQAAQQALEAMDNHTAIKHPQQIHYRDSAIDALRAALAEPEQEPFAYCYVRKGTSVDILTFDDNPKDAVSGTVFPLYTAPPQRLPLTEEEIGKAWSVADGEHNASAAVKRRITRAIEQAHGIKGEA